MKLLVALLVTSFCLWSCAPKQGATTSLPDTRVDEASYKAILDTNWCLPQEASQNFVLSWSFTNDGISYFKKTDSKTGIIIFNSKKNWRMNIKTLTVTEINSGVTVVQNDLKFGIDLVSGVRTMTWSASGAQDITLTDCGT